MLKKIAIVMFVLGGLYLASPVMAEDTETCVSSTGYNGAVTTVCGVTHEPVDTGLADINPVYLASTFFALASGAYIKARKLNKATIAL